eukprot:TRINITY_DN4792_c0_g2_i2.p1 TRINITY_DN4792_c0_g2~~TRINITY_DN4792_c0_g2_i2.p1  ORF type:complete len:166 (+),score=39.30 TRINITY_DN4792_c0_g2_i2:72-569(+)
MDATAAAPLSPAALITVAAVASHSAAKVWGQHADRIVSPEATRLRTTITQLKQEADQYNTPATFAKASLLERKAARLTGELEALPASPANSAFHRHAPFVGALLLQYAFIAAVLWCAPDGAVGRLPGPLRSLRVWAAGDEMHALELCLWLCVAVRGFEKALLRGL